MRVSYFFQQNKYVRVSIIYDDNNYCSQIYVWNVTQLVNALHMRMCKWCSADSSA